MTKVKSSLYFFISALLIIGSSLLIQSCKKECSSSIACGKGILNSDCICVCDIGYEGAGCDTETRTKFLGIYGYSENCSPSGASAYAITIATSTSAINKINIINIYNSGLTVTATVSGTSLTIASQPFSTLTISGSGSINANTLSLTYKVTDGINPDNCSGTGTK